MPSQSEELMYYSTLATVRGAKRARAQAKAARKAAEAKRREEQDKARLSPAAKSNSPAGAITFN